jgi:hypothetical protein
MAIGESEEGIPLAPVVADDASPEPAGARGFGSYFGSERGAPCYVCTTSEARIPVPTVAPLLQGICGLNKHDAFIALRHARGVLAQTSAESARLLVDALRERGVEAFAVCVPAVPPLGAARPFRRGGMSAAGLELQVDLVGRETRRIAWGDILVVAATVMGGFKEVYRPSETHHVHVGGGMYGGGMRVHHPGRHEKKAREDVRLDVLAVDRSAGGKVVERFGFDEKKVNYECLGKNRTLSGTVNFQRFAGLIISKLERAFTPQATLDFLTTNHLHLPVFENKPELDLYHRWCLCCYTVLYGPAVE